MTVGERRMVDTRVGSLAVRVRGEGPQAVLWHSLFVDDRSWHRVEDELARERRLIIISGPGHGASTDSGRRYTLDDCAAAALEVLASLGPAEEVDWVGNAWGGHVGIVFAAAWPDRCRTLVTFGTPIEPYRGSARVMTQVMLAIYRLVGPVGFIRDGIRDALLSPRTRTTDPEAVAVVLHCLLAMKRRELANAVFSISLARPDLTRLLGDIRCPTLFVTGTDHPDWTPEQAHRASRRLAMGTSDVVPDAAYLIPLEAPAHTLQRLLSFWAGASSALPATP